MMREGDGTSDSNEHDNPVASLLTATLPQATPSSARQDQDHHVGLVRPTRRDVLQCQFSSWYPMFSNVPLEKTAKPGKRKHRSNVTITSIVLDDLPPDFRDYVLSDGIRLPLNATNVSSCAPPEGDPASGGARHDNDDDDDDFWSSDKEQAGDHSGTNETEEEEYDSDDQPPKQFSFPLLTEQMEAAIQSLGGSVVPKLNWSAPKDATWMNGGSLKCKTPGDVYLLIKSSDFCLHDVLHAFDDCEPVEELEGSNTQLQHEQQQQQQQQQQKHPHKLEIVLRKWCNFHPSMEFRCFVRNHQLGAWRPILEFNE